MADPLSFLRRLLWIDLLVSAACALLLLAAAGVLAGPLGLPEALLRGAGLLLLPFLGLLALAAGRQRPARPLVWSIVLLNGLWVLASLLLLAGGWLAPTAAGYAFVVLQALLVGLFAELQALGLRRGAAAWPAEGRRA